MGRKEEGEEKEERHTFMVEEWCTSQEMRKVKGCRLAIGRVKGCRLAVGRVVDYVHEF